MNRYLAIDIGAESGRAILGTLENDRLSLKEIYRFPNRITNILGSFHWNIFQLYHEILTAMTLCVENEKVQPDAVGIDTWGVDYGLLNGEGRFLGMPFAYRDQRTDHAIEEFSKLLSRERIYDLTGIQFLQFNTLFQLFAEKRQHPSLFDGATDLLFMPDIFNYLLTGIKKSEFSFATTSQLYNPRKNGWEEELFAALGISMNLMQDIVQPGTTIGPIHESVRRQTGIRDVPVVAVASHDTGSAIAAIPATGDDWAFISSGTWSLMGMESHTPIITEKSRQYNFTNEGGVDYTFRVLKNIMGLWPLQQCKKSWKGRKDYSYAELVDMASDTALFKSFIDPDDSSFFNPEDMPSAIADFCRQSGQNAPDGHGEFVQIILQSLALKCRRVLEQLQELSAKRIGKIYITGGGIQNRLLNQYIASATGVPVTTALPEGTAAGNIMVQAMALGAIKSLAEIRRVIYHSIETQTYEPRRTDEWNEAYSRFLNVVGKCNEIH